MKRIFSIEEKMSAIGLVFQGESARSVSRKLHLGHHILYEWIESYKLRGIEGLKPKGKRPRILPYEEKCKIIREYQESELTLYQLSGKYGVSSTVLSNWARLVENGGFEALTPKKRGPKTGMARMKRLPKEEYEKENERLRIDAGTLPVKHLKLRRFLYLFYSHIVLFSICGTDCAKNLHSTCQAFLDNCPISFSRN